MCGKYCKFIGLLLRISPFIRPITFYLKMPRIEPGTCFMLSRCSTTKAKLLPNTNLHSFNVCILLTVGSLNP